MTVSYNPSAVINGLLLNLDFANPKTYQHRENLWQYSDNYLAAPNASIVYFVNTSTTITPAGTTSSALVIMNTTTNNYAYSYNQYVTTTSSYYTMSYYIKPYNTGTITLILGTNGYYPFAVGGTTYSIVRYNVYTNTFYNQSLGSSTTNYNTVADYTYGSAPAANGWTRIWMTANLTTATGIASITGGFYPGEAGQTGLWYGLGFYIWGYQLETSSVPNAYISTQASIVPKSVTPVDFISKNIVNNYYQSNYVLNNPNGYIQFNRYPATTSTQKAGGNLQITNPQGALSVTNFLYYDHTWEIWFRIDDISGISPPGDPTEGFSTLALYNGYHSGFSYGPTVMNYTIWSSTTNAYSFGQWSVGTSGAQLNQGSWYQIAVSKIGNTATAYTNGQPTSVSSYSLVTINVPMSNNINIGSAYPVVNNLGYNYSYLGYAKNSISIMRMYNRGLSAAEIQQNFNANRGRYGL